MFVESTHGLLTTKFSLPHPRTILVPRPHLLQRLDDGLAYKMTLIAAPVGFGKTTLLNEWLYSRREPGHTPSHCAWVSLDEGDNDPRRFWRYVITACQKLFPDIGERTLSLLRLFHLPSSVEALLTSFINELAELTGRRVLILDDYHVICSPSIHTAMAFLLDHLPSTIHLILVTRTDLPSPYARFRASHEICEIRNTHLCFSRQEIAVFLSRALPTSVPTDVLDKLESSTEGWVAGLQLAVLAMQEQSDFQRFLATFTGRHHYIVQYMAEEVLNRQPASLQTFLLQTSLFDTVTASLCDAVTGRNDSEHLLTQIEQANLFLTRVDSHWYRYHTLFAEAMRASAYQRFGQLQVNKLYSNASAWYKQHGFVADAVECALTAQEYAEAALIIEYIIDNVNVCHKCIRYEYELGQRWIERIPHDVRNAHPILYLIYAWSLLFSGKLHEALVQLQKAEQIWEGEGDMLALGKAFTLHAVLDQWWNNQHEHAVQFAKYALTLLLERDTLWRSVCLHILAHEYKQTGDVVCAWERLREGRILSQAIEEVDITLGSTIVMGDILVLQGKLRQAELMYKEVIEEKNRLDIHTIKASIGLGNVYFEWNDLKAAETYLSPLLTLDMQRIFNLLALYGLLPLARVKRALGDTEKAQEILHLVIVLALKYDQAEMLSQALAYQAWIALMDGNSNNAYQWSERCGLSVDAVPSYDREREYLTFARILIAQGQSAIAQCLLQDWLELAHEQERSGSELEILLLSALAAHEQADEDNALAILRKALALAQPEGYQRIFVEEGDAMHRLLSTLLEKDCEQDLARYICSLLQVFPQSEEQEQPVMLTSCAAQLTRRESSILRLLVQGLSYAEIAERETVSVNTIKTQLKSIYRKLQVVSRRDAVRVVQRLKLFPIA